MFKTIRRRIVNKSYKPYSNVNSNIGFKAIGVSSDYRTLSITEGKIYCPQCYTTGLKGTYYNFMVSTDDGRIIRVVNSDINTLFKVVLFAKEPLAKTIREDIS